jgi:nucleoside-diphosphate-sugar epimerase
MHRTLVILGAGYLARFIPVIHRGRYSDIRFTSRSPAMHLSDISSDQRILFDLAQPETWRSIPDDADLLWTFSAAPLDAVQRFAASINGSFRRLVVLGSTSAYDVAAVPQMYPPPWIDETAAVNHNMPRVQGEEFLRKHSGAVVLRVAGIYGPGRSPYDWIKHGRVRPSRKYVNLIHVEDLAAICLVALDNGISGDVYNVSDGVPRTWREICERMAECPTNQDAQGDQEQEPGKRISNAKLLAMLHNAGASIRHADLSASLSSAEKKRSAS